MSPVARTLALLWIFVTIPAAFARHSLTVLMQFEAEPSEQSMQAMKQELSYLLSEVDVNWRMLSDVKPADQFPDLVVVRFKGACQMQAVPPYLFDERGYYAFTHTSNGQVLPFSEVECDKVATSIRAAMSRTDYQRQDLLMGRALGRVLAHELHHVLAKSREHSKSGVNRTALTASELIADRIQ